MVSGVSLVKILVSQEPKKELTEKKVQCGSKCSELSKKLTQSTYSLKIPQTLEQKGSMLLQKDLPKQGMMLRGQFFQLNNLEHSTKENECGLLLPTPTASMMPCEGTVRAARKNYFAGLMTFEEACLIAGKDIRKKQGALKGIQIENVTYIGGKIHPNYVEWMMGWPLGWTDLKPLEMDKYHLWL